LREAVERNPDDALAWARLAELEQMFGELDAAQEAAEQAVALAPELARTQMVLGFAALTRIDIDQAKAAFERAIVLDSANPLPRLGLGLAKIRQSDLEEGRQEIEVAAALDPNDALIRSYLEGVLRGEARRSCERTICDRPGARSARSHAIPVRGDQAADRESAGRGSAEPAEIDRAQRQPRRLSLAPAARRRPRRPRHQPRADL
jgi:tetratricopeptide (TPR) repeat protein